MIPLHITQFPGTEMHAVILTIQQTFYEVDC